MRSPAPSNRTALEIVERADEPVGVLGWDGPLETIDEHGVHPHGLGADDVRIVVIADVRALGWIKPQPRAREFEDPGIRLVEADLGR